MKNIKKFNKFVNEDLTNKEADELIDDYLANKNQPSLSDFLEKLSEEKWIELGSIADSIIWGFDNYIEVPNKDLKLEEFIEIAKEKGYLTDKDAVDLGGWDNVMDFALEYS